MYKVLIVDDEQRTLEGQAMRIRQSEYDVEIAGIARDGIEALELTRTTRPDIILCDIRMPRMDGIEFTIKAKEIDPDIAIIFITGYSDRQYLKDAIRIGAMDYLDKPVDEAEFSEALGRAVKRRSEAVNHPVNTSFDQDTLRTLLTSNDEKLIRSMEKSPENAQYMVMVAMDYSHGHTDDTKQQFNMFTLHMVSMFSKEDHYQYTTLQMGNQIIFFIRNDQKHNTHDMENHVWEMVNLMLNDQPEIRKHLSIGIGNRFESLTDINASYKLACKALNLTFFRGIGSVLSHNGTHGGCYTVQTSQLDNISQYCMNDELLRVSEAVDRIFNKYSEHENTPAATIKEMTLKLYEILSMHYEQEFMEKLMDNPEDLKKMVMSSFTMKQLSELLHELIDRYTTTILTKDKKNGAIYKAKKYIWKHMSEDVSVKTIAEAVFLSPTYLCALFKDVTGITINQYVQQVRMEKAKTMLMGTEMTISNIADAVGYKNTGYFNRMFNRHTSMTPDIYRKLHAV